MDWNWLERILSQGINQSISHLWRLMAGIMSLSVAFPDDDLTILFRGSAEALQDSASRWTLAALCSPEPIPQFILGWPSVILLGGGGWLIEGMEQRAEKQFVKSKLCKSFPCHWNWTTAAECRERRRRNLNLATDFRWCPSVQCRCAAIATFSIHSSESFFFFFCCSFWAIHSNGSHWRKTNDRQTPGWLVIQSASGQRREGGIELVG